MSGSHAEQPAPQRWSRPLFGAEREQTPIAQDVDGAAP